MANRRKLLVQVEKLLTNLLTEAQQSVPATFDDDGIEKTPARATVTFGERLRLAEVVAQYEVRRAKIEEDAEPSDVESMMEEFHSGASRTPPRRAGGKTRPAETDGIANAGRALPPYQHNGSGAGIGRHGPADSSGGE
jgi:hypothetical protein